MNHHHDHLKGTLGAPVVRGYSAYEVYVRNGGTLSESEWLATLKGEPGDKGDTGNSGVYIGETEPEDEAVKVWIDTDGTPDEPATCLWISEGEGKGIKSDASCEAKGAHAVAEGYKTKANGDYSHAEGAWTMVRASRSHTEGYLTSASGVDSHAEGESTQADGLCSHAEGNGTYAKSQYQHVQGRYNVIDANNTYAHIVGGGTSDNARANIHTLDWNGNAVYSGKVTAGAQPTADNDLATKKYVDDHSGGGNSEYFFVHFTYNNLTDTYSADKTYAEIDNAFSNGKIVKGVIFGMESVSVIRDKSPDHNYDQFDFSFLLLNTTADSVPGSLSVQIFFITENNTVGLLSEEYLPF